MSENAVFIIIVMPVFQGPGDCADNRNMKQAVYTAAVIGTGRIGFTLGFDRKREQPASHTMALLKNRRIRIIAGCDTDTEALKLWSQYVPHAAVFSDSSRMLTSVQPDIVVVAVNENAHLETALTVLKFRPKLLILEKPVALTMNEGHRIADAARTCQVPVLVNHERRFSSDYACARSYIRRIGDLQGLSAALFSGLRVYSPDAESTGAYSLIHDGTHLVDIVLYLLGAVTETAPGELLCDPVVTGVFRDPADMQTVRNISVHYRTAVCPEVTFTISGRSRYFGFDLDIRGTEGRIRIGNGYAEFYRRAESKLYSGFYSLVRDSSVRIPGKTCYFSHMVQNAVDFLDGTAPLGSTLQDGLHALAVLEEIKKDLHYL